MSCSNCKCIHKVTGLVYTADTSLVVQTSNSTNISSLQNYCFVFPCNIDVSATVTGAPVNVYMNINGTNYPLYNKYHLPVTSDHLFRRKLYRAWFVTGSGTSWVELADLPVCKANA